MNIVLHARHSLTALILHFAEEGDPRKAIELPIRKMEKGMIDFYSEEMEGRLKSRCAGLLETKARSNHQHEFHDNDCHINCFPVVQFIHQTAKEFIEFKLGSVREESAKSNPLPDPYTNLLISCIHRLKQIGPTKDYEDLWSAVKDGSGRGAF